MNKRIIMSLVMVGAVAALAAGVTIANFSDTETSTGNTISAGTLDLKINGIDWPGTAMITVANAVPGGSESATGSVTNAGSIPGTLTFQVTQTSNYDVSCNEPELAAEGAATCGAGLDGELCANMQVQIEYNSAIVYAWGPLSSVGTITLGSLGAGETKPYTVRYQIPGTVGNEIQSDSCGFTMTATINQ